MLGYWIILLQAICRPINWEIKEISAYAAYVIKLPI